MGVVTVVNAPVEGLDEPIVEFVIVSPDTLEEKLGVPAPPEIKSCPDVPADVVAIAALEEP